jgi:hypothetical protein
VVVFCNKLSVVQVAELLDILPVCAEIVNEEEEEEEDVCDRTVPLAVT